MEKDNIRRAVVAGQFYPSSAQGLKRNIESFISAPSDIKEGAKEEKRKTDAIACMLPHAGYMYSGRVAGKTVAQIKVKDKVVLLGPNHTGYGVPFSIMTEGAWETPLGQVKIDSNLGKVILSRSTLLKEDGLAHAYEHSLEVELPFLQYFKDDFEIVPIVVLSEELDTLKGLGRELGKAIKDFGASDSTLIVASSDMTHYEPHTVAKKKDREAIEAILSLNEDKLIETVRQLNLSMCGVAPVVTMLSAAKYLGAKKSSLVEYQTSGDITGDFNSVVGYAGIIIY